MGSSRSTTVLAPCDTDRMRSVHRAALFTLIGLGAVAAPFLWIHHRNVLEDERREENARRFYGDPNDPTSKAHANQETAVAQQRAGLENQRRDAEAESKPMELPINIHARDVIGVSRAKIDALVPSSAGKPERFESGGSVLSIRFANALGDSFEVQPKNYLRGRDESQLRKWLEVPSSRFDVTGNINGHTVRIGSDDRGVRVSRYDVGQSRRAAWLEAATPLADNVSPRSAGFRIETECSDQLYTRSVQCDADFIHRVFGDSELLVQAKTLGFTTFVCEAIEHGAPSGRRVVLPLERVLTGKP